MGPLRPKAQGGWTGAVLYQLFEICDLERYGRPGGAVGTHSLKCATFGIRPRRL